MESLAAEVVKVGGAAVAVKGVIAVLIAVTVFIGSVYLLLSLVLGPRLAYWLTGSIVFGIMCILSIIWFGSKLGPKGPETTWVAIGAGPSLKDVEESGRTFDVSDYPRGKWEAPKQGRELVKGAEDTQTESDSAKPVLDTFVAGAVSVIPGVRKEEADKLKGPVNLIPQKFAITDIRMKQAEVRGKPSLIAVAKAVPSEQMVAQDLGGAKEGTIAEVLAKAGDAVTAGEPVLRVKADKGQSQIDVKASRDGRIVSMALAKGDKIKPGVPYAALDISGQPGQPEPVEVAAVRIRGAVRTPPLIYLLVSSLLFAIHMRGLGRTEQAMKAQAQTA